MTETDTIKGHVLYVEDDDLLRKIIARSLRKAGYEVITCSCVTEARNALKAFQYDVVISDWLLGADGNGGEVYELCKQLQPKLAERFVFVSSDPPVLDEHVPWLEKPTTTSDISRVIDELITRRQSPVGGSIP